MQMHVAKLGIQVFDISIAAVRTLLIGYDAIG